MTTKAGRTQRSAFVGPRSAPGLSDTNPLWPVRWLGGLGMAGEGCGDRAGVWAGGSGGGRLVRNVRRGAEFVPAKTHVGTAVRNNPAPPTYSRLKARTLMGSVIKKRRKRMAKKKHRKLLRKTRHQRRNKK